MTSTSIKEMSDKDLILETKVMLVAMNGSEYLPELVKELRLRGLAEGNKFGSWTAKADRIMGEKLNES